MDLTVRTIAPTEAQAMVARHSNFRKCSASTVKTYARLMASGKWELSVILLDDEGNLVDGQHRLEAVARSGIAQRFAVITGWPRSAELAIDNGANRTRSQSLIHQFPETTSANQRAALAVGIASLGWGHKGKITNIEAMAMYELRRDLVDDIMLRLNGPLKAAIHGVAFGRAILHNPDRREDLLRALEDAGNLVFEGDCMSGLRLYVRQIQTMPPHGGSNVRYKTYMRCARAVQAFLNCEPLDRLYVPKSDPFPID